MRDFDEINVQKVKDLTQKEINIIGTNLRKIRLKNNLTQQDVAFYIFTDKSSISALERGKCDNITLLSLNKIIELFNITFNDLFLNV